MRWILICIGLLLLSGIYLYGVYRSRVRKRAARETLIQTQVDSAFTEDADLEYLLGDRSPAAALSEPVTTETQADHLICHFLRHADQRRITGEALRASLVQTNIEMNTDGLLEYRQGGQCHFTISNISAPGHFLDLASADFTTLGLQCCLQIDAQGSSLKRYEIMLKKIDVLVRVLNLKVYQPNEQLLTIQDVTEIRQRITTL